MARIDPDIARDLLRRLDAIDTSELEDALDAVASRSLDARPEAIPERQAGLAGQMVLLIWTAHQAGLVEFVLAQGQWPAERGLTGLALLSKNTTET